MRALMQLGEPNPSQINANDILSAISFDHTGKLLSVGDRGGRVIMFKQTVGEDGLEDWVYISEFQGFPHQFNVMTSQDISQSVTQLEWTNKSHQQNPAILCANGTSCALFRMTVKPVYQCESAKKKLAKSKGLCIPKTRKLKIDHESKKRATYTTGCEKKIHSLSMAHDEENFLMGDVDRLLLWNIERPTFETQSLLDFDNKNSKGSNDEMIVTSAKFHENKSMFLYTTN